MHTVRRPPHTTSNNSNIIIFLILEEYTRVRSRDHHMNAYRGGRSEVPPRAMSVLYKKTRTGDALRTNHPQRRTFYCIRTHSEISCARSFPGLHVRPHNMHIRIYKYCSQRNVTCACVRRRRRRCWCCVPPWWGNSFLSYNS